MSKNIIIEQNGTAQNFTASVLRTAKQGGGSVDWVPEDEVQVISKTVTENGEYVAENENVYGYSEVITNGLVDPKKYPVKSKSISENGTYVAGNEGLHGYSSVHVSVRGGGKYTDPDTGNTVVPDAGINNGCAIVGKDEDGDEAMVRVDGGGLTERKMADHITIDTPPNKLVYADGERISLAGIIVRGYLKNNIPYKNASYGDSVIPLHQVDTNNPEYNSQWLPGGVLIPSPLYADASQGEGGGKSGGFAIEEWSFTGLYNSGTQKDGPAPAITQLSCTSPVYFVDIISSSDSYVHYAFSKESFSGEITSYNRYGTYRGAFSSNGGEQYLGETWHTSIPYGASKISIYQGNAPTEQSDNRLEYMYNVLFGQGEEYKQTITLTWPREGDRKHLQTTYEITIGEGTGEWTTVDGKTAYVVTHTDGTTETTTTENYTNGTTGTKTVERNAEGKITKITETHEDSIGTASTTVTVYNPETEEVISVTTKQTDRNAVITTETTIDEDGQRTTTQEIDSADQSLPDTENWILDEHGNPFIIPESSNSMHGNEYIDIYDYNGDWIFIMTEYDAKGKFLVHIENVYHQTLCEYKNGKCVKETLIAQVLRMDRRPTKKVYKNREPITLDGAIFRAYGGARNDDQPIYGTMAKSVIPKSELIVYPKYASYSLANRRALVGVDKGLVTYKTILDGGETGGNYSHLRIKQWYFPIYIATDQDELWIEYTHRENNKNVRERIKEYVCRPKGFKDKPTTVYMAGFIIHWEDLERGLGYCNALVYGACETPFYFWIDPNGAEIGSGSKSLDRKITMFAGLPTGHGYEDAKKTYYSYVTTINSLWYELPKKDGKYVSSNQKWGSTILNELGASGTEHAGPTPGDEFANGDYWVLADSLAYAMLYGNYDRTGKQNVFVSWKQKEEVFNWYKTIRFSIDVEK